MLGFFVALFIALLQCFTIIPAGHTGVIDFLGYVSDNILKPGVNIVNPRANVEKMSIKTQELKELMNVPSQEGLSVELEISLLYKLDAVKANEIYKTVGPNYVEIILVPQFRSVVRGVTARYEAEALYTASRERLAGEIVSELEKLIGPRVVGNDSGVLTERDPDTVRGADVSYYSYARVPRGRRPKGYPGVAPELVIEVLSPSDTWAKIPGKVSEYLEAGVIVVCVVDPNQTKVFVYRADSPAEESTEEEELTLPDLLPAFRVRVGRFFD